MRHHCGGNAEILRDRFHLRQARFAFEELRIRLRSDASPARQPDGRRVSESASAELPAAAGFKKAKAALEGAGATVTVK